LIGQNPITDKIEPALAKSWEVLPDQKTFVFHLHEGLCWSDGQPLNADDVMFTFQAIYDKRYPNRESYDFSDDGRPFQVTKINDTTIQFRTPDIFAPFLLKLGGICILPRHILEPAFRDGSLLKQWTVSSAQKDPGAIVVSGPYKILSYHPGERIVLEPNPYYYKTDTQGVRLPYVEFLIRKFVSDQNACIVAFASGQTDAERISPDNLEWVRKSASTHHFTVYDRGPSTTSNFLWFNQNPGKDKDGKPYVDPIKLKWFQDVRFRQAVSYGIDRQGIIDGVLAGRATPLWSPESPANTKWYNSQVIQYPYNPEKSRQLLTEAGFHLEGETLKDSEGHPVEFKLFTNHENPIRMNMATIFKENMRALGINVQLQFIEFGAFVEKISDSFNYEAAMLGLTGDNDPSGGMSVYMSGGRMHQWYPSQPKPATAWEARIDQLMIAQLRTIDDSARKKYYDEVQLIMSEQCPYIYLVTPKSYVGYRTKWQNIQVSKYEPFIWNPEQLWEK
jgi:peptide/nickel transport system substrate-binding protein